MSSSTVHRFIDNPNVYFKHDRSSLKFQVSSDWDKVESEISSVKFNSVNNSEYCPIYYPPGIELDYSDTITAERLNSDIQQWPFMKSIPKSLYELSFEWTPFCSAQRQVSYERKALLHRHLAWMFPMDEVSERLPLYNLHTTAGKTYLDNLKSLIRGGPIEELEQFRGACPDELIELALHCQRTLTEDLMPMKKRLLSPQHYEACVETLDIYFDYQYKEGLGFCTERRMEDILRNRALASSGMMTGVMCMTSSEALLYRPIDGCLIQICQLTVIMNDIMGLFKDLDSIEGKQEDGSAYLNMVRVSMRDHGYTETEALRLHADRLNHFTRHIEFSLATFPVGYEDFYKAMLAVCIGVHDFHLVGMEKGNNRYGWKKTLEEP